MNLDDQQKPDFYSLRTYFRVQNGTSWRFAGRPCRSMLDLLISKTAVSWRWPVRCSKIATTGQTHEAIMDPRSHCTQGTLRLA
jgi:hypothetical protein